MDGARTLDELDPEQRTVVLAPRGPVCVLAGAGTGKTRAITRRIAQLVAQPGNRLVNRLDRTQIDAARSAVPADDVGGVVRRTVGVDVLIGLGIERTEDRELEQRGILRDCRLHGSQRHRLRLRAELGKHHRRNGT